jgi:phage-related protein
VIVDVFAKNTQATPATILATGRQRLRQYDQITRSEA